MHVSELLIQILSGVGLFFLGILFGVMFYRTTQGETSKNKRLEQKLAELQEKHSKYQAEVSAHFMDTAEAVSTLNKSYRDVHTQLAKGASKLCNDEQANDFLSLGFASEQKVEKDIHSDNGSAAPMDYAPKEDESQMGTLSESYGLDNNEHIAEMPLEETINELDKNEEASDKGQIKTPS